MSSFVFLALLLLLLVTMVTPRPVPTEQVTKAIQEPAHPNTEESTNPNTEEPTKPTTEEPSYRSYSSINSIMAWESIPEVAKWILGTMAMLAMSACLCLPFLMDFFDKYGHKIPVNKILDLYKKNQEEEVEDN